LIVFEQAANAAAGGAQGGVEHVHVGSGDLAHLFGPAADAHGPALEVGAVGARYQLPVVALFG